MSPCCKFADSLLFPYLPLIGFCGHTSCVYKLAYMKSWRNGKVMRVLIVDDDENFCRLLVEILERQRWPRCRAPTDSRKGYEMFSREPYDLFIFDVCMPLSSGTELAEGLKQMRAGAKIILISSLCGRFIARKISQKIGVPLLSKPFTPERLLETVERTLSSSQERSN